MTGDNQLTLSGLVLLIGSVAGIAADTLSHRVTNCTNSKCPTIYLSCSPDKLGLAHVEYHDRHQKKCGSLSFQDLFTYHGHCSGKPTCTLQLTAGCLRARCPCVTVAFNCAGDRTNTATSTTPTVLTNAITVATDTPSQATAASGGRTIDRNAPARNSSINLYPYIGIGVGVFVVMSILVAIACRQIRKQEGDNSGDASSGNSESYEAVDATLNKATETGTGAGQKKPGN